MTRYRYEFGQKGFGLVNALACVRAAELAYRDPVEAKDEAARWGFERFHEFTRRQHYGFAMGNPELIVLAFRGTDESADWWANLNILPARSHLGPVHRGFMKATNLFWPELPETVKRMADNSQSIWVTGHSLGGALALLAGTKLGVEDGVPVSEIVTFGQPAVGRSTFCRRFEEEVSARVHRFINHTDAVVDSPSFRRHVGEVRYFDTAGKLWEGDPPWSVGFLDHIRAPKKHGGLSMVNAHPVARYVELLEAKIGSDSTDAT